LCRARYVDQGGGKRKGAFAIYLEPWHGDIFDWLDLRKNHGKEEARCRDLFYGLWVNDLFMQVPIPVECLKVWTASQQYLTGCTRAQPPLCCDALRRCHCTHAQSQHFAFLPRMQAARLGFSGARMWCFPCSERPPDMCWLCVGSPHGTPRADTVHVPFRRAVTASVVRLLPVSSRNKLHAVGCHVDPCVVSPQRVESNGEWSLFCPSEAPGLADTWGPEFEALYAKYESEGRAKKVIRAQSLWFAIMDAQVKRTRGTSSNCSCEGCTGCCDVKGVQAAAGLMQTPAAEACPVPFPKHGCCSRWRKARPHGCVCFETR